MAISKEEARDIVKEILPIIKEKLKIAGAMRPYPKTSVHVRDILPRYPALRREGITSDVFCKIAEVFSEQGITTDIDAPYHSYRISFVFSPAEKGYKKPSSEICKKRLERAMRIERQYHYYERL